MLTQPHHWLRGVLLIGIFMLALGARGVISPLANIVPRTVRDYVDAYERGDMAACGRAYADIERAAARRAEFDALLEELTRVVRPGGRSRAFTGADERARTSVQKALRRAIAAIGAGAPKLADALTGSIQTGSVCRFEPVDLPFQRLAALARGGRRGVAGAGLRRSDFGVRGNIDRDHHVVGRGAAVADLDYEQGFFADHHFARASGFDVEHRRLGCE